MENTNKKSMEWIVYDKLKNAILQRTLAPGTQLIESTISDKLNTSRTPIRYAIKRLSSEGFITIVPNKGAFIIKPNLEEITQAYTLRIELECISLKYGLDNISEQDLEILSKLIFKEFDALKNKNIIEYFNANKEFHMMIAKRSNNKFLFESLEKIIDQINIYLILYDTFYTVDLHQNYSIDEHKKIVDLIKDKDITKLDFILREHLGNSLRDLEINKSTYKSLDEIF